MSGQLCLKWNNHTTAFNKLLDKIYLKDLYADSTILCEGHFYPVHRFVLSTCSEYFDEVFKNCKNINNKQPFIIVKDVKSEQMEALLNYMYKGEVNVPQDMLPELIKAAEAFKIKGLAVPDEEFNNSTSKSSSNKKRTSSASSHSPLAKKNRRISEDKNLNKEEFNSSKRFEVIENNLNNNEKVGSTDSGEPIFLDMQDPEIKEEPHDIPTDNVNILESQQSLMKEEQEFCEENISYENYSLNDEENFDDATQSTSWDGSQGFEGGEETLDDDPTQRISYDKIAWTTMSDDCTTGEKKFKCPLCLYKTDKRSNLGRHYLRHTGQKRFHCDYCSYKCNAKSSMLKHNLICAEDKIQQQIGDLISS